MSFRQLGEREHYRGHVFAVATGTFEAPDGSTFERDFVRHPGAVSIVAVDDADRVPLVRQFRGAIATELLELPAGKLDVPDEEPESCARRELAEEVGLAASSWELLCEFHNSPGCSDERHWIFLARGLTEVPHDRQGVEESSMTVEWVRSADAVQLVRSGDVKDAKTVIGLLLADELLHRV